MGAKHCPLGLHALWGLHAAGVVGGRPRSELPRELLCTGVGYADFLAQAHEVFRHRQGIIFREEPEAVVHMTHPGLRG